MEKTIAGNLAGSASRVASHLVYGEPSEAIIDRARKIGADLLILEVHRSKRLSSPWLKSAFDAIQVWVQNV